ncbi:MAG: integration host factor subunit beta [Longimicrobiales bacterium]|nr:integration host factor subunit beta [Longimicrobiales bacterium]
MTKADLVNEVMEAIGPGVTKKDCSLILEGFLKAAKRGLVKGETIEIRGFGTLAVKKRKSRVARNPKTGKVVQVPAREVPVFKPSKQLRSLIEGRV